MLGFIVILAPLVVVHELGHFLFAKLFGVKAEVFSIGFGPKLWSRKYGETDFRVSAVPLGGYVKLLGEEPGVELPPEDKRRSLQAQLPWKRFFIFLGGPLFNFIFAVFVFMAILAIGEPQLASVIGRVEPGSEAATMGFRSGDEVQQINGQPVKTFHEVVSQINDHPNQEMRFTVLHPGEAQAVEFKVTPTTENGFSEFGEETQVGKIDGMVAVARSTQIGISDPQSPAGRAGLKTGDQITEFNGQAVTNWEQVEAAAAALRAGDKVRIQYKDAKEAVASAELTVATAKGGKMAPLADWGLHSSELFVDKALADAPASKAGIQKGDRIARVGGDAIGSFYSMRQAIQKMGEKGQVEVTWEREGKFMTAKLTPTETKEKDPLLNKITQYTIGIAPMLVYAEMKTVAERILNPFTLVYKGVERTVVFSWRNLVSILKMFTGDVSVKTLGGPLLIAKIAGDSLEHGLVAFLTTMAILSVGLGILNILPVPVLDGGHILLLGVEWIRGKALTVKQMEFVQQVGLSLILLLMIIVMKNDILRFVNF
ncbi:MAG: RIP metalloprotease RseP [Bacteriovoracia bacterium]